MDDDGPPPWGDITWYDKEYGNISDSTVSMGCDPILATPPFPRACQPAEFFTKSTKEGRQIVAERYAFPDH